MGLFAKVRETYRDKSRDILCAHLRSLGVDAQIAERGRPEEKIGLGLGWGGPLGKSLGVIDISGGLIHWVNVEMVSSGSGYTMGGTSCGILYGVPDPKICLGLRWVEVRMVVKKSLPLFGRVIDIEWRGNRHSWSLAAHLNNDFSLKNPLMERERKVKIRAYPDHGCWIIMEPVPQYRLITPPIEVWQCYQRIAQHLLSKGSLIRL
jgi:hypothetical protein